MGMGMEKKISTLRFKNALGIEEKEITPTKDIVEISGRKGTGKTSILDSIKMLFDNKTNRADFIRDSKDEAVLYTMLDDGEEVERRKRTEMSDVLKIKGRRSPQTYLTSLFSKEQFNPLRFLDLNSKDQNKVLLSLVEDKCSDEDFVKWFGIIPDDEDYKEMTHTLEKLDFLGS